MYTVSLLSNVETCDTATTAQHSLYSHCYCYIVCAEKSNNRLFSFCPPHHRSRHCMSFFLYVIYRLDNIHAECRLHSLSAVCFYWRIEKQERQQEMNNITRRCKYLLAYIASSFPDQVKKFLAPVDLFAWRRKKTNKTNKRTKRLLLFGCAFVMYIIESNWENIYTTAARIESNQIKKNLFFKSSIRVADGQSLSLFSYYNM